MDTSDIKKFYYSAVAHIWNRSMKNHLLELEDKKLLSKRSLIESVFNVLKNHMSLEHSRHRSPVNFLVHVLACLAGYAIKKSTLKLDDLSNSYALLS